jgi:hypothetical protein
MLLLVKSHAPAFNWHRCWSVAKLAGINLRKCGSFSYWFDNLGFTTEGKLAVVLIIPSSWGSQRGVIYMPSPPAYVKGGLGEENTQLIHEPLPSLAAHLHLLATNLPWLPPSTFLTPVWPPKGLRRRRGITTAARRHAAEFSEPCLKPSTSAILARSGILGVIVITVRVRVRGGATRAVSELLLQDLHDLEVDYVVFIVNACVGA